ncbi:MAG TPA: glycosyltransferase [Verrucomicrobiota bacterium]|nr:glycosyltransferase [Verrucomicrobiota bacterium]
MKFSIVIPAFNEGALLDESLRKLKQSLDVFLEEKHSYELILCDNNSTDRTAQIAHAHSAQVIFEPENQISKARNKGASIANGDYLIFIDADSFASRVLFKEFLEKISSKNVLGGGALVYMKTDGIVSFMALHLWRCVSRLFRWAPGSFIFCRRDIFEKLGGFSTEYFASEEIDFSKRLKREARRQKKSKARIVILKNSVHTSDRKLHLYGVGDYLKLVFTYLLKGEEILKKRENLPIWYDGKR